jgi:hypothetical protein
MGMAVPGPDRRGELNPNAKLSLDEVRELRHLRSLGVSYRRLSSKFGVSLGQVWAICRGKAWR